MKLIIAGSRHMRFEDKHLIPHGVAILERNLNCKVTSVVCGLARGADTLGKRWAMLEANIPVHDFPANWALHGKAAGPIRNGEMADFADALLALMWDNSRGTANMVAQMQERKKPVLVISNGDAEDGYYWDSEGYWK